MPEIMVIATETPMSLFHMHTYEGVCDHLTAMTWGAEDLSSELGALTNRDENGLHTGPYQLARSLCLAGAVGAGLQPVDTVYPDFRNEQGLRKEAQDAARDGFTGKMAIHPAQVPIINEAFTPSSEDLEKARAVISAFAAEPKQPKEPELKGPELKFVTSTKELKWVRNHNQPCMGPIRPKYVATVFIKTNDYISALSDLDEKEVLLKTFAGKSMSAEQKEFLTTKSKVVARIDHGQTIKGYLYYRLYAVSQDDAKKMAAALIEALNDPQIRIPLYKRKLHQLDKYLSVLRNKLANKNAHIEMRLTQFRENKLKGVPYLTIEEAKKTISELNEMLNLLQIDRAGIIAKVEAISRQQQQQETIRDKKAAQKMSRASTEGILLKLEEMKVDLSIEYAALERKVEVATHLRKQAEDFYKVMSLQQFGLERDFSMWREDMKEYEWKSLQITKKLAFLQSPGLFHRDQHEMSRPVEIERNTVTIYPVESVQDAKKAKAKGK